MELVILAGVAMAIIGVKIIEASINKKNLSYLFTLLFIITTVTGFGLMLYVENMDNLNDRINSIIKGYLMEVDIEDVSKEKIKEIIETEDVSISYLSVIDMGNSTSKKITYEISFGDKLKKNYRNTFIVKVKDEKRAIEFLE